ncbi:N-6 DNA methylase [Corynebacterium sp. HS2168-gen11]|uniref:type I restriction-modification system subunit M n=1 Tax=Corynebacterium sp. HS2168-gen11 TaxID=2974027 RepID=UPI00216B093B|nr:N-6 DNA methylase [Corynebacterium sp. HS2168-gen11]MCS4536041.1 N-6 DNA methylase [Corynebacterium sp. HS2168-gen11]
MSTEKTTNYVSFIWKIANLLRGDYKEHEYGDVILPFTVLTRLDSVLVDTKDKVAEIRDGGGADEIKCLQYARATGYSFWNTSKFTLDTLKNDPDNLEGNLTAYVQAFSSNARDVMESYDFFNVIERLDRSGLLFQVLNAFTDPDVDLSPKAVSNADMGTIFEELIRRFNELSNETAGEHFTPREVINLMVNILFEPDMDEICKPGFMASLYDPGAGTGGMLSAAIEQAHNLNDRARIEVYGQELNPQTYAVAKSDTLIKGEDADRIYFGNSLTDDKTAGQMFNYMLCNPPFGVEWKKYADPIKEESEKRGWKGRFGAGLPRISDGSFLFLQHMISKMKPYNPNDIQQSPGTRIAVVFNGSPLFTGAAGSGESNIRQWILEHDWLEAIIALPDQMFYNTGILTYVWVLSNRKEARRKNKVQLIDATSFYDKLRKPLGEKRKYLTEANIADVAQIYGSFTEGEHSKIFDATEFGFHEVTVERPLRLNFQARTERIERLWEETAFKNLASSKKRSEPALSEEIEAGKQTQFAIISVLESLDSEVVWKNRDEFTKLLKAVFKDHGLTVRAPVLKAIFAALGENDPSADICYDSKGNVEPDPALRDTEQIPLSEDIDAYIQREVIPYAADAYVDSTKTKVGYEIPFTRYFYQYEEFGDPTQTLLEIQTLGAEIQAVIAKLFNEQLS